MVGVGFGALQEILDRGFRTREQVRSVLATDCLALVPQLTKENVEPISAGWSSSARHSTRQAGTVVADALRIAPKALPHDRSMLWAAIDTPLSPYAEAIRSLKVTIDLNRQGDDQCHWADIVLCNRGKVDRRGRAGDAHCAERWACHFSGC